MTTTIKSKKKSKIIKRLNSQSPLRPLLRKCNQKKRNKQDSEATLEQENETDKTISPQRSSTPEIYDFEDVSDFDSALRTSNNDIKIFYVLPKLIKSNYTPVLQTGVLQS